MTASESSRVDWLPMDSMTSPSARCVSAGEPGSTLTTVAYPKRLETVMPTCAAPVAGSILVDLVLGGGQVAGVGIERLKQAVQRAGGHVAHVGFGHVVGLDLLEDLGIDAHLAVGAILVAAGVNAEQAELAQGKAQAEGGKDGHGEHKDRTLKESGHTHHRGGPQGEAGRIPIRRNDIARVRCAGGFLGAWSRARLFSTRKL